MISGAFAQAAREGVAALFWRVLFAPFRWLVPRDASLWVVMGREHGKFLDNAKHFFCWLQELPESGREGVRAVFVSEHPQTVHTLRGHGARALGYPSLRAAWTLLRAGTLVVDSADFIEHGRIGLIPGARLVQLWHGAPLKEIELPLHERRLARLSRPKRALLQAFKWSTGRFPQHDVVVSTSRFFTDHAFAMCFRARRIPASGYPRNDAMLSARHTPLALTNVDTVALDRLRAHRASGGQVLLYAPTFRQDRHSPFSRGGIDLERWAQAARSRGLLLALKLHPLMFGHYPKPPDDVVDISAESDAYPLLSEVDVLVTDYSSIYFDFLLLDRPVWFYAYDFDRYTSEDRALLFDYDEMTPGPKLRSFDEVLACTLEHGTGPDEWAHARQRVLPLAFDHRDAGASERLWRALAGAGQ